ncbi:MAG: hypothetical protein Q7S22_06575, partial [Candidatus Micrarchaeota archaeon]|nr:hypothetical protein [Candidatus Micrarchaeota archaeon]
NMNGDTFVLLTKSAVELNTKVTRLGLNMPSLEIPEMESINEPVIEAPIHDDGGFLLYQDAGENTHDSGPDYSDAGNVYPDAGHQDSGGFTPVDASVGIATDGRQHGDVEATVTVNAPPANAADLLIYPDAEGTRRVQEIKLFGHEVKPYVWGSEPGDNDEFTRLLVGTGDAGSLAEDLGPGRETQDSKPSTPITTAPINGKTVTELLESLEATENLDIAINFVRPIKLKWEKAGTEVPQEEFDALLAQYVGITDLGITYSAHLKTEFATTIMTALKQADKLSSGKYENLIRELLVAPVTAVEGVDKFEGREGIERYEGTEGIEIERRRG